jgi:hypothetical protein
VFTAGAVFFGSDAHPDAIPIKRRQTYRIETPAALPFPDVCLNTLPLQSPKIGIFTIVSAHIWDMSRRRGIKFLKNYRLGNYYIYGI